jgi:hypothetical protein
MTSAYWVGSIGRANGVSGPHRLTNDSSPCHSISGSVLTSQNFVEGMKVG